MSKNNEITVIKYTEENDLIESCLILNFSGKKINTSIINGLRRVSYNIVPMYSLTKETINIEKNKSIYNNDYMKNRLEQFCIKNINNSDIDYLPDTYWDDIDYTNEDRERHPKDNKNIEVLFNVKNNSNNIMSVTTNDCIVKLNNNIVEKFNKKFPHLIIKLRPNEEFISKSICVLGIGEKNAIWSPIKTCFYEEKENNFTFTIRSKGQESEFDILIKACRIIKIKLNRIRDLIKINFKKITNEKTISFIIQNENHTMGNIITTALQDHKDIIYAGYGQHDLLLKEITLKIVSSNKDPLKPFNEVTDYLVELFSDIETIFIKLKK